MVFDTSRAIDLRPVPSDSMDMEMQCGKVILGFPIVGPS
jgi:hypothetical protein